MSRQPERSSACRVCGEDTPFSSPQGVVVAVHPGCADLGREWPLFAVSDPLARRMWGPFATREVAEKAQREGSLTEIRLCQRVQLPVPDLYDVVVEAIEEAQVDAPPEDVWGDWEDATVLPKDPTDEKRAKDALKEALGKWAQEYLQAQLYRNQPIDERE